MIRLAEVSKRFHSGGVTVTVADRVNLEIPDAFPVALLGRNGAGKSSLLKMISGTLHPDSGRVEVAGTVSWPVGFSGSLHGDLTGLQNARFVARIYGVSSGALADFVADFSGLGDRLGLPVLLEAQPEQLSGQPPQRHVAV